MGGQWHEWITWGEFLAKAYTLQWNVQFQLNTVMNFGSWKIPHPKPCGCNYIPCFLDFLFTLHFCSNYEVVKLYMESKLLVRNCFVFWDTINVNALMEIIACRCAQECLCFTTLWVLKRWSPSAIPVSSYIICLFVYLYIHIVRCQVWNCQLCYSLLLV